MGYVDQRGPGMHRQDGALHRADIGVIEAEVGEQRHDTARLHAAMLSAAGRPEPTPPKNKRAAPRGGSCLAFRLSNRASTAPVRPASFPGCLRRAPPL